MKVAIGDLLVASADCHADHEPVPVAAPDEAVDEATGVLLETKVELAQSFQLVTAEQTADGVEVEHDEVTG